MLLAAELRRRDPGESGGSAAESSCLLLPPEPCSSKSQTMGFSPRNMEVEGVLPVLQVGPYQPGLHWQMSGVRHSPPFSQCLLQTTTIQEGGKKIREGRRGDRGWEDKKEIHYKLFLICFSVLPQKLTLEVTYNSS